MSIRNFVFQLSNKIQQQHSIKIKRSHIYELIAAFYGYNTYNSLINQNLIIKSEDADAEYTYLDLDYQTQHQLNNALTLEIFKNPPQIDYAQVELFWDDYDGKTFLEKIDSLYERFQDLIKLDISEDTLLSLVKTIYKELLKLNLEIINFRDLREELSDIDFEDGFSYFSKIGNHLEEILYCAENLNTVDAYALLAWYYRYMANHIAPYGPEGSNFGSTWDNNAQCYIDSVESLDNKFKYRKYIRKAEIFESYLKEAPLSYKDYYTPRTYNAYTGEEYDDYGSIEV